MVEGTPPGPRPRTPPRTPRTPRTPADPPPALILAAVGAIIGTAWASLATYLGSLLPGPAMLGLRAAFLTLALFAHGYVRSSTPRLYLLVLLMILPVLIGLTSPLYDLTPLFPKQFLYPILTAVAIVLLVNVAVFPEFGSTYLGSTTIETLQATLEVQKGACRLFVTPGGDENLLKELTTAKSELRRKVAGCKAALVECSFELAFSVLAPWELKPIASKGIKKLVSNTVSLVGACESEYALLGRPSGEETELLRPRREIEGGDAELLRELLKLWVPRVILGASD